jgi:hypothetical protein
MKNTCLPPQTWLPTRIFRRCALAGAVMALAVATVQAQVPVFTNVWSITNASFPDLPSSGDSVRGIAISPVTTNVVYASRAGGSNHVSTLDIANGYNKLGSGVAPTVSGGTLALIATRVADDGRVYACNLSGAAASRLLVYRWESDTDFTTPPLVVYDTGAGTSFPARLGDYMDVRGSGADTEIVLVGNGSAAAITTNFVILKATDALATNFSATSIYVTNVNIMGGGVAFEGTNSAIYVRTTGDTRVYRITYDLGAQTSTIASVFNVDLSATRGLKYKRIGDMDLMAAVTMSTTAGSSATAHRAKVFKLLSPTNAQVVLDQPLPLPTAANGNGLGLVDIQKDHFVFSEPNNGIAVFKLTGFITNTPPSVGTISGGGTYVGGYPVTLSVNASGTAPLAYQWYFNTNTVIPGATTNSYAFPSVQPADAGIYTVVVTNAYGSVTSSPAGLTVLPGAYSNVASNLWTLAPGSRPYLTTGDTQRGIAYDAVSNVVVVVSRSPSNAVYLLDADTGADVGNLDVSFLYPPYPTPPGILPINMCGVADDGAIYVGNLLFNGTADNFTIYRWQSADAFASVSQAYLGNPGVTRLGDTMAVRGAGVSTEILCSFRTGTNIALFTTFDGFNFSPTVIPVTNLPDDALANGFAGLGLAFGPGNTFWAKSSGFNLRQLLLDTNTMTAQVIATYTNLPVSEGPLGVDSVNDLVATVAFGQTPRNLSLWDVSAGEPEAVQVDRELFGSSNANINGTGAVAMDVAGGRIFALDSNNGLIAVTYAPRLFIDPAVQGGIVTWNGPGTLQSSTNLTTGWSDVLGATSPYTNSSASQIFFRVRR